MATQATADVTIGGTGPAQPYVDVTIGSGTSSRASVDLTFTGGANQGKGIRFTLTGTADNTQGAAGNNWDLQVSEDSGITNVETSLEDGPVYIIAVNNASGTRLLSDIVSVTVANNYGGTFTTAYIGGADGTESIATDDFHGGATGRTLDFSGGGDDNSGKGLRVTLDSSVAEGTAGNGADLTVQRVTVEYGAGGVGVFLDPATPNVDRILNLRVSSVSGTRLLSDMKAAVDASGHASAEYIGSADGTESLPESTDTTFYATTDFANGTAGDADFGKGLRLTLHSDEAVGAAGNSWTVSVNSFATSLGSDGVGASLNGTEISINISTTSGTRLLSDVKTALEDAAYVSSAAYIGGADGTESVNTTDFYGGPAVAFAGGVSDPVSPPTIVTNVTFSSSSGSVNTEAVVAPFDLSIAPVGSSFPDVASAMTFGADGESTSHPDWRRLGREQSRSMDVSGIQLNRESQDGSFYSYGGGRKVKGWTVQEDLMVSGQMADFTLETIADMVEDGQTVLDIAAAKGVASFAANATAGAGYENETVRFKLPDPSGGLGAALSVTVTGGVPGKPAIIAPGRYATAPTAASVKAAFDTARTPKTPTTAVAFGAATLTSSDIAGFQGLSLGRRGGRLAKTAFAFLIRGAASPYVDGERAQIEIPQGIFEGSRNFQFTRADPIKYDFQISCLEDRDLDGYASLRAID